MNTRDLCTSLILAATVAVGAIPTASAALKTHRIFSSDMVLQRDKPITIWGWAEPGQKVAVVLGDENAEAKAGDGKGRWEVTFAAREADAAGLGLKVTAGDEVVEMSNILIGDVWVMNGQSNMAWGLGKTVNADIEMASANLPLLRQIKISSNESYELQEDLPEDKVTGWVVCSPETAGGISAIGYAFGSRVQRVLQVPVGIIDNARGGASIESLVPRHMFDDDPLAKRYAESVEKRRAEFDEAAAVQKLVDKWEKTVAQQREKGVAEDKLPARPTAADLRSWSIPGKSPSDAGACYNGMFGVFKGLNIKGVLFHQGYNNAMGASSRPGRYRVLMKLMVEGWRKDFNDPNLPVGVIGFCAGSIPQTRDNFEVWTVSAGAFIRESQRLGLEDAGNTEYSAFLPAYDVQIPGLHPFKKRQHGTRAARWALNKIYGQKIGWDSAKLESAEPAGDRMVLTFDKGVYPDDMSTAIEGFSIAGEDGKFYMAHAAWPMKKDVGIWNTANKSFENTKVIVWSPLVGKPVAVRYGWGTSPMGNLKVNGKEWLPLQSFRTDGWDWPESEDPEEFALDRGAMKEMQNDAAARLEFRKAEEAKRAVEILDRLKQLGKTEASK